ncbi:MAG: hypothetical protein HQ546_09450, partial [Planctomycetes bacterium]|nr:hypothetical protein [Planctomycetota bacterium]
MTKSKGRPSSSRRQKYLRMLIQADQLTGSPESLEEICFPPIENSGRAPDWLAYVHWSLYQATRKRRHAEIAKR